MYDIVILLHSNAMILSEQRCLYKFVYIDDLYLIEVIGSIGDRLSLLLNRGLPSKLYIKGHQISHTHRSST